MSPSQVDQSWRAERLRRSQEATNSSGPRPRQTLPPMQNDAQEGISWGASSQQFSQHLNYYSQGRCSPEISRPSGNRTLPGTSIQGEEDDEGPEKNIYQECYKLCVEEIEAERRRVLNITMLIYGATPDDLPATLRQEVLSLVQVQPLSMEGFMMPAECLRLSIDVFLRTEEDYSSAAQSLLHNLPTRVEAGGAMPWHRFPVQIRIPNRLVSIFDGKIQWWSPPASAPAITAIWPRSAASGRLMIDVSGIPDGEEADILFRVNGEYLKAAIDSVHHLTAGVVHLVAALPEMRFGLCWVEAVQRGQPCKMPSAPVPILLTNNLEAAEEVAFTFDDPEPHSPAVMEDLLQKLASVLHPDIDCIPTVEDCAMLMVKSAIYGWAGMLMALASIGERYHFLVEVVVESDKGDIGLLAFAALSSNLETVDQVSGLLEQCSIPLGLGELRGPLQMSPLHWAALSGNEEIVDLLLSMDSSATSLYESLGGGPQQMTPSQMSAQRHQLLNGEAIELPKPARDAEMPPAWVVEDDTATSPWPPALHAVQQLPGPSRPQPPVRRPSLAAGRGAPGEAVDAAHAFPGCPDLCPLAADGGPFWSRGWVGGPRQRRRGPAAPARAAADGVPVRLRRRPRDRAVLRARGRREHHLLGKVRQPGNPAALRAVVGGRGGPLARAPCGLGPVARRLPCDVAGLAAVAGAGKEPGGPCSPPRPARVCRHQHGHVDGHTRSGAACPGRAGSALDELGCHLPDVRLPKLPEARACCRRMAAHPGDAGHRDDHVGGARGGRGRALRGLPRDRDPRLRGALWPQNSLPQHGGVCPPCWQAAALGDPHTIGCCDCCAPPAVCHLLGGGHDPGAAPDDPIHRRGLQGGLIWICRIGCRSRRTRACFVLQCNP
uniref:Uncharacterized protein n=1 Tax=Tetraselmis sp. GSL018 TaxID=582737 RepID=A0A061RQ45_9CHLO